MIRIDPSDRGMRQGLRIGKLYLSNGSRAPGFMAA
jgi:hypothetical protein